MKRTREHTHESLHSLTHKQIHTDTRPDQTPHRPLNASRVLPCRRSGWASLSCAPGKCVRTRVCPRAKTPLCAPPPPPLEHPPVRSHPSPENADYQTGACIATRNAHNRMHSKPLAYTHAIVTSHIAMRRAAGLGFLGAASSRSYQLCAPNSAEGAATQTNAEA